jgi:hypothetical protein
MKFVTIEVKYDKNNKPKYVVGALIANDVEDGYEQMATAGEVHKPKWQETLVIKADSVPQLIVDIAKMMKKLKV